MPDEQRSQIVGRIRNLQNTRDYAAPEYEPRLTAAIEHLLDDLEKMLADAQEKREEKMYTITGQQVQLVQGLMDGTFLVEPIYEIEGREDALGMPTIVKQVFDAPPTAKIAGKVVQAKLLLEDLQEQLRQVGEQLRDAQDTYEQRMTRYAPYAALEKLDAFIAGEITHYVVIPKHGVPEILTIDECGGRGTRLLSLFGDSDGDLTWHLNQYQNDDSTFYTEVVPCLSYEKAVGALRGELYSRMEKDLSSRLIDAAEKHGIFVPTGFLDRVKAQKRERIEKAIQERRQGLKELEERLAALDAGE